MVGHQTAEAVGSIESGIEEKTRTGRIYGFNVNYSAAKMEM